jgi:hypothetical protein
MRRLRLYAWFLLVSCLVPPSAPAQSGIDSTTYPPRLAYRHALSIIAPYDGAQDKTVLQIEPFPLDSSVSLSALTALDGRRPVKPPSSVVLTFWSTGPVGRYAADRSVRAILNGTDSLDLGNAWLTPQPKPGYAEVLLKGLSPGKLLAMANASTVLIRLGPSTFMLTDPQLQGLRDFASRMAPQSR